MLIRIFKGELSFREGFISMFYFHNTSDNFDVYLKESDEDIDKISIYHDWKAIGNDFQNSIKHYEQKQKTLITGTKN